MEPFYYKDNHLYCEEIDLSEIAATYGTPAYVYSKSYLLSRCQAYLDAFHNVSALICYSVKAASNISLLKYFASLGLGCDIVSGGELFRAQLAGIPAQKIVYSGVGKTAAEISAALDYGILFFNVESEMELSLINQIAAEKQMVASVSLRVNPDVDPLTHPYISTGLKENKFGIPIDEAARIYIESQKSLSNIKFVGIDCHIGSQLTNLEPFRDCSRRLKSLLHKLLDNGLNLKYIDVGGGLGICYKDEIAPEVAQLAQILTEELGEFGLTFILEPGRSLVGNSAVLLTQVQYLKANSGRNFAIVDAGMNDLLRPSLYDAYQEVLPLTQLSDNQLSRCKYDLVGPICESGDFIAKGREFQELSQHDLLAVKSAGAYGFSMSSNYNSRLRPVELLVDGSSVTVIREREKYEDLVRGENFGK